MALAADLQKAIDQIIAHYKEIAADGKVTVTEVFGLVSRAVSSFVTIVEGFGGLTGDQKKAVVLEAVAQLYDQVIAPMDLKGIPNLLEPVVDNAIKQLLLVLASGWIDTLVSVLNRTSTNWGVPTTPSAPDVPGTPAPPALPPGFQPY